MENIQMTVTVESLTNLNEKFEDELAVISTFHGRTANLDKDQMIAALSGALTTAKALSSQSQILANKSEGMQ